MRLRLKAGVESELKPICKSPNKRTAWNQKVPTHCLSSIHERRRVCSTLFVAVLHIHQCIVAKYAWEEVNGRTLELMDSRSSGNQQKHSSRQSIMAIAFLDQYSELHAMLCLPGRESHDKNVVRYLSKSTSVNEVYPEYAITERIIYP